MSGATNERQNARTKVCSRVVSSNVTVTFRLPPVTGNLTSAELQRIRRLARHLRTRHNIRDTCAEAARPRGEGMAETDRFESYYSILGVSRDASAEELSK